MARDGKITDAAGVSAKFDIKALQDEIAASSYSKISSSHASSGEDIKKLKDAMDMAQHELTARPEYKRAQINRRNNSNE